MAFIRAWSESFPPGNYPRASADDWIRYTRVDLRERLEIEHSWNADANDGRHLLSTKFHLRGTAAAKPSVDASFPGRLYFETDTKISRYDTGSLWEAVGALDHGSLDGLSDDDHAQYLNTARHDVQARHPEAVIGDLSISTPKLQNQAVTSAKIALSAVTTNLINNSAVTNDKILTRTIAPSKIQYKSITSDEIQDSAIGTDQIAGGCINEYKLQSLCVTNAKLAADSVTSDKIAADAVGSSEIAAGAVGQSELASNSVTTVKILNANVTEDKIGTGAVTETKIGNLQVTEGKLASSSVSNAKIQDNSIGASKLQSNSVTTAKIADGDVTNAKLEVMKAYIKFTIGATPSITSQSGEFSSASRVQVGEYQVNYPLNNIHYHAAITATVYGNTPGSGVKRDCDITTVTSTYFRVAVRDEYGDLASETNYTHIMCTIIWKNP